MNTSEFEKLRPGERLRDKFGHQHGTIKNFVQMKPPFLVLRWDDWTKDVKFDVGDAWMLEAVVPKGNR